MQKSNEINELAGALCKFQSECPPIQKKAKNTLYGSLYAELSDILQKVKPHLKNNGLSFSQIPEGEYELTTILMHTSGQYISSTYSMKPVSNEPHEIASCKTYQKRIALTAILGLDFDEDKDGNTTPAKKKLTGKEKKEALKINNEKSQAVKLP